MGEQTVLEPVTDENIIKKFNENKKNYSGFYSTARKFVTGEGRTQFPDIKEVGKADELTFGQTAKIGVGNILTPDINARMQILKEQVPNATFTYDDYNNPMVTFGNGQSYYMNKPGWSQQDFSDLISEGLKYWTGGKLATTIADPKKLIGGTLSQAGGAGVVSIGGDIAAKGLGAEDNIDLTRAGIVATLTGSFVPLGALGKAGWTKIFGNKKYVNTDGSLTKAGIKKVKEAGYDPDTISASQAKLFQAYLHQGGSAKLAAAAVEDGAFGIPYYKAQLTGDKEILGMLENARKGAFGGDIQKIIMDGDARQQYTMLKALQDIQENIRVPKSNSMSGASYKAILQDDEAGSILISSLRELDDKFIQQIDDAYKAVDENAFFNGESLVKLKTNINKNINKNSVLDADLTPQYNIASKKLNKFIMEFSKNKKGVKLDYATIKKIDTERKKISGFLNNAEKGSVDFKNLTIMKKEFDNFFDDAIDQALFTGDEIALENLKFARGLVKEHKAQLRVNDAFNKGFVVQDEAGRVINKIIADPDIMPEQALNYIFGRSSLGMKDSSLKILKKLIGENGIYKRGGAEWDALRQGAFNRIIKKATYGDGFHADKFVKDLYNATHGNGKYIMQELFTPAEIQMFKDFSSAVQKTITPKEVLNPSGTADALARLFSGSLEALAKIVGFKAAGMQGLIAAKILNSRGRQAINQKAGAKIIEGIGDNSQNMFLTNRGLIGSETSNIYQGLLANEPNKEQLEGLIK
tara:strand:+ start:1585 stop:3840 length:2256 start_codon:yes stop_codon:yes gene_type:complete